MGYIKKLKNNELVGGTDKTTIYPVTSAEAVFEEVIEDGESNFKSQKFLNNNITGDRINEGTITDYNIAVGTVTKGKLSSQVQTMLDEGQKKALTPKGNYNPETEYEALDLVFDPVTNSSYISLQTPNVGHPVDENAEGYEEGWWEKTLDGTAVNTAQAAINNKVDQLNTQVNNAIGQANQDIQDLIDASQEALQAATDEANDAAGEARDAASTVETLTSQQVADAQIGYFTCTNAAASGAAANETKITTTDTIGESHYVKTIGSHVKVKMAAANTHAAPVYLQFGSNTATRSQVYYNGAAVDASNSWEEGETISVFYDGTHYQASNAQGGGKGMKEVVLYATDDVPLIALNTEYSIGDRVKDIDGNMLRIVKPVTIFNNTKTLNVGDLILVGVSNKTYKANTAILNYEDTVIAENVYALGYPARKRLTIALPDEIVEGNIDIMFNDIALNTVSVTPSSTLSEITSAAIEGINIEGWALSSDEGLITADATSAGASTAAFVFTDSGNTGLIGTPSSLNGGGNTIARYVDGAWVPKTNTALRNEILNFSEELTLYGQGGLVELATEQNSITKDLIKYDNLNVEINGTEDAVSDITSKISYTGKQVMYNGKKSAGREVNYTTNNNYKTSNPFFVRKGTKIDVNTIATSYCIIASGATEGGTFTARVYSSSTSVKGPFSWTANTDCYVKVCININEYIDVVKTTVAGSSGLVDEVGVLEDKTRTLEEDVDELKYNAFIVDKFDIDSSEVTNTQPSTLQCQKTETGCTFTKTAGGTGVYSYFKIYMEANKKYVLTFNYTYSNLASGEYGGLLRLSTNQSSTPVDIHNWVLKKYPNPGTITYEFTAPQSYAYLRVAAADLRESGSIIISNIQLTYGKNDSSKVKNMYNYVYPDVPVILLNHNYAVDTRVKSSDDKLLRIVTPIDTLNIHDRIKTGDLKTSGVVGTTYKALKDIADYTGNDADYSDGDYAFNVNGQALVKKYSNGLWALVTSKEMISDNSLYYPITTEGELIDAATLPTTVTKDIDSAFTASKDLVDKLSEKVENECVKCITVNEDGMYFVDKYLNIGVRIDASGFHAININE